jgi:hypothetical protein
MAKNRNSEPARPARAKFSLDIVNVRRDGVWRGNELWFRRRKVAEIVPDNEWPNMWRVAIKGQSLSDMVNRTRAKDAAYSLTIAAMT